MKFFKYKGTDQFGYQCGGSIRAVSEDAARAKLKEQGKKIDWLEPDYDANVRMRPETIANLSAGAAPKSAWNEILSYAMPIGAAVVALIGILIVSNIVKPPKPDNTPTQLIESYGELDRKTLYDEQYLLLSKDRREFFKSAENYDRQKKRWRRSDTAGIIPFGRITKIEKKEGGLRKAHYIVPVLRPSGLKTLEFLVVLEREGWRVDHFRDPHVTDKYIDAIKDLPDEDMRRKYMRDLKGITGYSDLQIEAFLKGRRA